jgi:S1-C subfamily serine protease
MKQTAKIAAGGLILLLCTLISASAKDQKNIDVSSGTVKIVKTFIAPDYNLPWKMKEPQSTVGSGVVIKGGKILTSAHVVSDSKYIQVKKENDPETYDAEIEFIGHDCDLALLKVKDKNFHKNAVELELGDIPELRSKVTTYGYPMGGSRISITEGVISRIDIGEYTHTGNVSFLMIQTDAAINPGNSGGPVVQNNKIVGIAFQASVNSDNIGFMIPVPVIKHFLLDVKDGIYNGFPSLGVFTDMLENSSYRRYLGMRADQSGVLVTFVIPNSGADDFLKPGDVILSIDSVPIANDGSIKFKKGRLFYSYLIDIKQLGETVALAVLRKGKVSNMSFVLKEIPFRISWFNEFETLPRYYIYGGIIFQVLSKEYLRTWDKWWYSADRRLLYYYQYHITDKIFPARKEFVLINRVLPDEANTYISDTHDKVVDAINGMKITNLMDVVTALKKPTGDFHVIRIDGTSMPLVLKASRMDEANSRIKQKYNIPSLSRLKQ